MDFDRIIDRRGTGALKWNSAAVPGKPDVVPLWVADMDFAAPDAVVAALKSRAEHPVYGYTNPDPEFFRVLAAWYSRRYGAAAAPGDFLLGPGVVPSLALAARTFADKGEGVVILPPVYYPFKETIIDNGRVVVPAPLGKDAAGRYRFDRAAADAAVAEAASRGVRSRVLFLCNPHNPGGVVWSARELTEILGFAAASDLVVVSDEIHGDLVFEPARFVSLADFPGAAERTVVVSTANKTFNIAGLHLSHFVVKDPALRARVKKGLDAVGYSQPNVFSLVAAQAAYSQGDAFVDELRAYLKANAEYAARRLNAIPGVEAQVPEGTYLVWANAAGLIAAKGLKDDRELAVRLEADARVRPTAGSIFGVQATGFVRVNVALPRSLLQEGLDRWEQWAKA